MIALFTDWHFLNEKSFRFAIEKKKKNFIILFQNVDNNLELSIFIIQKRLKNLE